ncbi:glycosyltransferase [Alphaproteobacteria bacterium]|nr:glycosyltransferase [Alphaproteobacteria bacterium]
MQYKITVGIPSCKRPDLLERALKSFVKKNLKNLYVIISIDGIDSSFGEYKKIESNYKKYNFIRFYYHKKNIGSLKNFLFLKDISTTKYFMWLADDDESNTDMIYKLFEILENNNDVVTAVPYWELAFANGNRKIIKPSSFSDNNVFLRILKYVYYSDDAFFYGLHKLEFLNKCSFKKYWWPNTKYLSNWCYVFQFDLIIQGKIFLLKDKEMRWINHDYGPKHYPRTAAFSKIKRELLFLIRKVNIYYFYLAKLIKWRKYSYAFILFFIFFILYFRDIIKNTLTPLVKKYISF